MSTIRDQWDGLSRAVKGSLIGVGSVVVVGVIAIAVFVAFIVPQRRAQDSFGSTVAAYAAAQSSLANQITSAQDFANSVLPAQVKDPSVLTTLTTEITSASTLIAPAPQQAADAATVLKQIDDMNNKIKASGDAITQLQKDIDAVQQSRIDLAYDNVAAAVKSAQQVYDDSAGRVDNESLRTALKAQIDNANAVLAARTGPSAIPSQAQTTDQAIVTLNGLIASLSAAAQAVTNNEQKVANTPYTYLLTGNQISCGVALCSNAAVPAVKVTVSGTSVTADVCSSQQIDWSNEQAIETCTGMDGSVDWWTGWTGTRDGATAIIQATGSYASPFFWATITFASAAPEAPATGFSSPDRCQRMDGSMGQNVGTGCA